MAQNLLAAVAIGSGGETITVSADGQVAWTDGVRLVRMRSTSRPARLQVFDEQGNLDVELYFANTSVPAPSTEGSVKGGAA